MATSNNQGRAYEYAYLIAFEKRVKPYRDVVIVKNSAFEAAQGAWDDVGEDMRQNHAASAVAGVKKLLEAEPLILDGSDTLEVKIQTDEAGKSGDVRDILVVRNGANWEIGLSVKHKLVFQTRNDKLAGYRTGSFIKCY